MAKIDLKNATIYLRDGYSKTGAVNNVAGYSVAATTMTVDGFTGAVANDDVFLLAGHTTKYKITAHTETSGNTTSITFTPGLASSVADNVVINVGPHELEVKIGEGNLSYDEKRNMEYSKDRGKLDTVREGDEEPVEVRMDFTWEFLKASSGNPPTVHDALKKRGNAADWVSSSDDQCEPFAVDIVIENIPPCSDEDYEVITLADYRYETLGHDAKAGTVSTTGKCNVKEATVTRVTAVA